MECRERFSSSSRVSDPDMQHGTCVTHVPWCMPGSLTKDLFRSRWREETFPAFPAHAQPHNFTYLARGPWLVDIMLIILCGILQRLCRSYIDTGVFWICYQLATMTITMARWLETSNRNACHVRGVMNGNDYLVHSLKFSNKTSHMLPVMGTTIDIQRMPRPNPEPWLMLNSSCLMMMIIRQKYPLLPSSK